MGTSGMVHGWQTKRLGGETLWHDAASPHLLPCAPVPYATNHPG
jgi:hypothetical protein